MIHLRSLSLDNMRIFTAFSFPGEEGGEAGVGAAPAPQLMPRPSPCKRTKTLCSLHLIQSALAVEIMEE